MGSERENRQRGSMLLLAASAASLAWLFTSCDEALSPPAARTSSGPPANNRADTNRLLVVLKRLNTTSKPKEREEIISGLRGRSAWAEAPISWVLDQPQHDFLTDAIELAAKLPLVGTRPRLAKIAFEGPADCRADAVHAAHRLRPWDSDELQSLLAHHDPDVVLAGLSLETEKPFESLVRLLDHEDTHVRTAAARAVPAGLAEPEMSKMLQLAAAERGTASELATRALGGDRLVPTTENTLTEIATDAGRDAPLRIAALRVLATKRAVLDQPERVLAIARDGTRSLRERARALSCLESTDSIDSNLLGEASSFHPVLRYYVARCLIRNAELVGIEMLITLLESKALQRSGGPEAMKVFDATRSLLGTFSSTGNEGDLTEWKNWYRQLTEFPKWIQVPPATHL